MITKNTRRHSFYKEIGALFGYRQEPDRWSLDRSTNIFVTTHSGTDTPPLLFFVQQMVGHFQKDNALKTKQNTINKLLLFCSDHHRS